MSIYKDPYEEYLCHHGVLGMKWGIRKAKIYATKAGKYHGKRFENDKKFGKLQDKHNQKLLKLKNKVSNKRYTNYSIKAMEKELKLASKGQRYMDKAHIYDKKVNNVIKEYRIKDGKKYIDDAFYSGITYTTNFDSYFNNPGTYKQSYYYDIPK